MPTTLGLEFGRNPWKYTFIRFFIYPFFFSKKTTFPFFGGFCIPTQAAWSADRLRHRRSRIRSRNIWRRSRPRKPGKMEKSAEDLRKGFQIRLFFYELLVLEMAAVLFFCVSFLRFLDHMRWPAYKTNGWMRTQHLHDLAVRRRKGANTWRRAPPRIRHVFSAVVRNARSRIGSYSMLPTNTTLMVYIYIYLEALIFNYDVPFKISGGLGGVMSITMFFLTFFSSFFSWDVPGEGRWFAWQGWRGSTPSDQRGRWCISFVTYPPVIYGNLENGPVIDDLAVINGDFP